MSCVKEGEAGGVTAYCICPGAVETAMLRASFDESVIPPADTMAAEEVAAVVLACVRGERPGDNGRTIPLLPRSQRDSWASWRLSNPSGWLGMQG